MVDDFYLAQIMPVSKQTEMGTKVERKRDLHGGGIGRVLLMHIVLDTRRIENLVCEMLQRSSMYFYYTRPIGKKRGQIGKNFPIRATLSSMLFLEKKEIAVVVSSHLKNERTILLMGNDTNYHFREKRGGVSTMRGRSRTAVAGSQSVRGEE
jgi:hypothetical protein